jgi:hypothetical protein
MSKFADFNDPFETVHRFDGEYSVAHAEKEMETWASEQDLENFHRAMRLENPDYVFDSSLSPIQQMAKFFVESGGRPIVDPATCISMADEFLRVCCFSRADISPGPEILQWAYYANKHAGVRIEFDLNERLLPLREIIYSEERVAVSLNDDGSHSFDGFDEVIRTKCAVWGAEHEVRLILKKECAQIEEGPGGLAYYFPFERSAVRKVDFGINCPADQLRDICLILDKSYPHAIRRQAKHHPEKFEIQYMRFEGQAIPDGL